MPDRATRVTCGGCGCLCDDLLLVDGELRADHGCDLGRAWFAEHRDERGPAARIDGRPAGYQDAVAAAARLLRAASAPLLYGLGRTSCEAVAEAVALADRLGAALDTPSAVLDGGAARAVQLRGASTASLGEIRDRRGPVVLWREDPIATHPRLLERLALDATGRAARGRRLIGVGLSDGAATEVDGGVALADGLDLEALRMLRLLVAGVPVAPSASTRRLDVDALTTLAGELTAPAHLTIIHGAALGRGPGGHRGVLALHELVRELNRRAVHTVTLQLRREPNAVGADNVLAWQTGYAGALDLGCGHPRSLPGEGGAAALLAARSVDAVLSIASDPADQLPDAARTALAELPIVAIDALETATTRQARVAIATTAAGIGRAGVAHRMDGVPIPLRAPAPSARPGEDQVLRELSRALAP